MTLVQALVLGIIQGLAEFLPISSSAHLSLTPWLFGWTDPGLAFDASLHLGTLLAVLWFFRDEWQRLTVAGVRLLRTRRIESESQRRLLLLVVATIPAGIAGLLLEELAETVFRAPIITAIALITLGVLLWWVDRVAPNRRPLETLTWGDALLYGLAQVVALVPGVSRSGSTITAGRALGYTREAAAVFSFLMSMPITLAAVVLKLPDAIREAPVAWPLLVGVVASAASGWLAISVLLKFVSRHSYGIFAAYRIALALVVLLMLARRG